jgi:hypothetical protein
MALNMAMLMGVEPRGLEGAEETPPVGAGSRP